MSFDSTPGASTATSFLSVARADEIASERAFSTNWTSISSTATKQAILSTISRLLSLKPEWLGVASYPAQSLAFPRTGLIRVNGSEIDPTTIPLEVELATFEWALAMSVSDTSLPLSQSVQGLTKLKAGPVELSFREEIEFKPIPDSVLCYIPLSWYVWDRELISPVTIDFEML